MTALTISNSPAPMPVAPPELAQKLATFDGMDLIRGNVSPVVVEQAKRHLAALEAYHRAAPAALVGLWCRKLRGGVAPISEAEFSGRLEAIQECCSALPGWVWSAETLRMAWRAFKFFPTANEVFELLDPIAQKGLRGLSQVRMLAAAQGREACAADEGAGVKFQPQAERRKAGLSLAQILGAG